MNSKLVKASLAGAAAIALAAGGGTFAAWSDFYTDTGNHVGADVLALTVNEPSNLHFDDVKLAPGVTRDLAFYVASRNGTTVPDADLTVTLKNLIGTENGCDSNSEAAAETNGAIIDKTDQTAPCNLDADSDGNPDSAGQFLDQAAYYIQAGKVSDPSQCNTNGSTLPWSPQLNKKLSLMSNVPVNILPAGEVLSGGQAVCVLAHIFMPKSAGEVVGVTPDNASQGDQASFDVKFDLTQV